MLINMLKKTKYHCRCKLHSAYTFFLSKFCRRKPLAFNIALPADRPYTVTSQLCNKTLYDLPLFTFWMNKLKETPKYHRKQWEYAYVSQALYEHGMLQSGKSGLVFGVGKEHTVPLYASMGCQITATDMPEGNAGCEQWKSTDQYIKKDLSELNETGICDNEVFKNNVHFRNVDMNDIPADLKDYDFCWSICALEHLGSIENGLNFIKNSLNVLKPGGIAVHTTEYNLVSDKKTIELEDLVVFRHRDILRVINDLEHAGHYVFPLNLDKGKGVINDFVDRVPYDGPYHLKLEIAKYACTSIGLIIIKKQ